MNKTVLVTGGSRGIGSAIVRRLAADGWRVAFTYHTEVERAETLCRELTECGYDVAAFQLTLGSFAQTQAVFDAVKERFGHVDALVNNAGVSSVGLFHEISEEEWARVITTDLSGAAACCRAALPDMIRAHSGKIVNISSIWGISGASCEVAYSAAKSGLIGLSKALAKEVGPSGITVNVVAPGVIDTDMNRMFTEDVHRELAEATPLGREGKAEEVAASVAFLLSGDAEFVTGQVLSVDGGFAL